MRTETSTHVKNHFGEVAEAALREPVVIQKSGRNSLVLMAYADYENLMAQIDKKWGEKAKKAKQKGMIGTRKSGKLINTVICKEG